jgi:hypothetical protein
MFVDAFLLAVVLVVWVVYILFRSFGRQKTTTYERPSNQGPGGDVFLGGTAKKDDQGELVLTGSDGTRKNHYGFVEFGTLPDQFTFRFELLIEEPDLGVPLHAFIWLSLGGDPDKESAVSSNAIEDGGTRLFLLKTDAFGQRETLEVFRTIAGIARPSTKEPWDLVERVQYMPKNQWILVTLSGDLRSRTFRMTLDDAQFSFVVPMHFQGPFRGGPLARAYLGAKTLKGTGIRVRNLGIAA